ncbi:MAG: hypothetical protein E7639_04885 [Ruminococcaceae bacterium]|nr:hypothetical protein [Oscillospiraceae bacterium]
MKRHVMLIAYTLVLCITVTFAWILSGEPHAVPFIEMNYTGSNKLVISSTGVRAEVLFREGQDYVPAKEFTLDSTELVPNTIIPFKITLDHQSLEDDRSAIAVKLSLSGIRVSDPRLLSMMYISVTPKNEDLTSEEGRGTIYKSFSDAEPVGEGESITYRLNIYDSDNKLLIPHNDADDAPSELECYLYFDRNADATYQGLTMDISYFRLEQ